MSSTTTRALATLTGVAALASSTLLAPATSAAATTTPAAHARATTGWSAVLLGKATTTGSRTLVLVSPTGAQYTVRAGFSTTTEVEAVSGDGRRVLLDDHRASTPRRFVVDVRTGAITPVKGAWSDVMFTRPSGTALVARGWKGTVPGPLVRTTLTGAVQVTYAGTSGGDGGVLSPDGTVLVSAASRGTGLLVNGNQTGRLLRRLASPKGYHSCLPVHFSDATHVTATCMPLKDGAPVQTFRYATGGGAPVALTSSLPSAKGTWTSLGYSDAWSTPAGPVVRVVAPCGPSRMARVKGTRVTQMSRPMAGSWVLGVVGGSVYYVDEDECGQTSYSVSRHDIATDRNVELVGPHRNKGLVVTSARLIDATTGF